MHAQPHRQRQPFLDKFEGKKNLITKQGLLELLQKQLESISHRPQNQRQRRRGPLEKLQPLSRGGKKQSAPLTEPHSEKKMTNKHLNRQSEIHSQHLQGRYGSKQDLRSLKSQQLMNKVKLPSINKSSSLSIQGNRQRVDVVNAEVTGTTGISGSHRAKSLPKRTGKEESSPLSNFVRRMELDNYAIRHLEFLDKFQKQLLHNDLASKRTVKSQVQ